MIRIIFAIFTFNCLVLDIAFTQDCIEAKPIQINTVEASSMRSFATLEPASCFGRCKGKDDFLRSVTCPKENPESCYSNAGSKGTDDMQAACSGECRGSKACKYKSHTDSDGPSGDGTIPDGTTLDVQPEMGGSVYTVTVDNGTDDDTEADVPQDMGDGEGVSGASDAENKVLENFNVLMWYVDVECECQ